MATVMGLSSRRTPRRAADLGRRDRPQKVDRLGEILSLGVIPRLLIAHSKPDIEPVTGHPLVQQEDVEQLAPVAVHEAAHVLLDRVESIMRRGIGAEDIFVDLLAPVARWIGREWDEDRLDFVQVSMALWRLQEVLRQIAASTSRADEGEEYRSALFAPMPGDQHSFGAAMIHECFTIAGWDAELMIDASRQQLIGTVAERRLDLLGLTLSCDSNIDRLASLIRAVRSVSMNPHLCILIGGRVPAEQPHIVALSGADGTAATAPAAIKLADRLVGMLRLAATA